MTRGRRAQWVHPTGLTAYLRKKVEKRLVMALLKRMIGGGIATLLVTVLAMPLAQAVTRVITNCAKPARAVR